MVQAAALSTRPPTLSLAGLREPAAGPLEAVPLPEDAPESNPCSGSCCLLVAESLACRSEIPAASPGGSRSPRLGQERRLRALGLRQIVS